MRQIGVDADPARRDTATVWMRFVTWARAGAALYAALITLGVALQSLKILPDLPKLEPFVWVVSLAIIAVDNIGTLISRRIHSRWTQRTEKLEKASIGLGVALARHHKAVRFEEIGVTVYVETRRSRMHRRFGGSSPAVLKRLSRHRPTGHPQQSGIAWTEGKGVVGTCWAEQKTTYRNLHKVAKQYAEAPVADEAAYLKISAATRQGLDRFEFAKVIGKYSEVLAEPIWDHRRERRLMGVLTVDRVFIDGKDPFMPQLGTPETRQQAAAAASTMSRILMTNRSEES